MAVSFARLAKQRYDAATVALTWCSACHAPAGSNCRRSGRVCATPCEQRMNRRVDLCQWLAYMALTYALYAFAGLEET